jgi:hypothetical protein
VHATSETSESSRQILGRPQLIFFSELDSPALEQLLEQPGLLADLSSSDCGIAVAVRELSPSDSEVFRLLNQHHIPVIAWLQLPPDEGYWFNLQNYPQAIERYRAFRSWARTDGLRFHAVGLDIEPPIRELSLLQRWGLRDLARRLWLARENVLYPAARAAYADLIAEIHHDGYEVHTYQLPVIADDRRAGTTLVQRSLDVIDLPADVEVLMCYSSIPLDRIGNDFGGALISSYGPAADGIGVGSIGGSTVTNSSAEGLPPLSWEALERDLLLAAHYTDTIYVLSLEGCVERGLIPRIAALNWDDEARVVAWKRVLVAMSRSLLFAGLLLARFSRGLIAWLGWGLAIFLLFRQLRAWRRASGAH